MVVDIFLLFRFEQYTYPTEPYTHIYFLPVVDVMSKQNFLLPFPFRSVVQFETHRVNPWLISSSGSNLIYTVRPTNNTIKCIKIVYIYVEIFIVIKKLKDRISGKIQFFFDLNDTYNP